MSESYLLPEEIPRFWKQVGWFANLRLSSQPQEEGTLSSQDAQLCMKNLLELYTEVSNNNKTLLSELCKGLREANNPLDCALIEKNTKCIVWCTLTFEKKGKCRKSCHL